MLTKRLLLAWLYFLPFTPDLSWASNLEYWSYQEYQALFPQQGAVTDAFAARVRQPASPLTKTIKQPVHIAMLIPDQQISDYWSRNKQSLAARLQEIGLPFSLSSYSSLPTTTHREQEQQLADALRSDPDYLVLTLNSPRQRVVIDKLITRSRPKIILMNITSPLKHLGAHQPFFYVGFDHREGTRLLTERINTMTGKQANYLMLYGTRGYVSEARGDEFIQLNLAEPDIHLRQAVYTDVDSDKSRQAVTQILSDKPDIDLIYACTTDVALGAAEALKQLNKQDQTILNGWGGGSAELDALAAGDIDVTVMRMNDDNGVAMAEAIRLDQEKRNDLIPQIYSGDFVIIDKQTPKAELERLKNYAFRYSK